jgi:hypothetical protein
MQMRQRATAMLTIAAAMVQCLAVTGCQSGLAVAPKATAPGRVPFVAEFKKIDTAGKGRITLEQATAYYTGLFARLDKNGDGYLDVNELEAMLPAMDAQSGKELLLKLDRNSDGRLSQTEFLIAVNWLFQLATSPNELALGDVEG